MLTRITTLLLLVGSVAWFARDPGWEPGLLAASSLATLLVLEVQRSRREPHPHDVALFEELLRTLPPPAVENVRTHGFGGSIRTSDLHPLWEFAETWIDVGHEFHDPTLEQLRRSLLSSVERFNKATGTHTFKVGHDASRVYPDAKYEPPDYKKPEYVREATAEIDQLALAVAQRYRTLVEAGRNRLRVAPGAVADP